MSVMVYQITGFSIVCWAVCSGVGQSKHQSSASLAFVMGDPWTPSHKGTVTQKMFPFDDVIMRIGLALFTNSNFITWINQGNIVSIFPFELSSDGFINIVWCDGNVFIVCACINTSRNGNREYHSCNLVNRLYRLHEVLWLGALSNT